MNDPLIQYVLRHMTVMTNLCTRQRGHHGYELKPRLVPDHNFIYILRGRVAWVIDGKRWNMGVGDLVIVPPQIGHHGFSLTQRVDLVSVHVEVNLPGGQDVFNLLNPPRFQHVPRGSLLDRYFRGIASEFDRSAEEEIHLMLPGWTHLIVRELIRLDAQSNLLRPRVADPLVAKLLEELDQQITRPVMLTELAARSGFSPQHLNRIFQRALGMTPLQYLLRLRLERAATLLREARLTVHAIGKQVGFADAYYFSRLFRQYHGQSPVQYRNAMNSDSPSPRSKTPLQSNKHRAKVGA